MPQQFSPPEIVDQAIHWTVLVGELFGVAVIILGAVVASGRFIGRLAQHDEFDRAYHSYRANLGRAILLGLEILVAADIIRTIAVAPTWENVGLLAVIVTIRTFLSISLEVEIDGYWPWNKRQVKQHEDGGSGADRI